MHRITYNYYSFAVYGGNREMTISDALKQLISIRLDTESHIHAFPNEIIFKDDLEALDIAIYTLKDILKDDENEQHT